MFNATKTKDVIAKSISALGTPVSITMASGGAIKTVGVFATEKKSSDTSNPLSFTSPMTVGSAVCYLAATAKVPSVGDDLTSNGRSYNIVEIEVYRPANIVIGYKLTLE